MMSSRAVGAGAFVIVGSLLFAIALFTIGERRMLFKQRFSVYTEFAKLGQLEAGSIVRVAGMNAGAITDIQIPSSPNGRFRVRMEIREDLRGLVRTDSVATVQTDGLVGAIVLNILSGTEAAAAIASDGTIPSREPFSMTDLLDQASATVRLMGDSAQAMRGDVEKTVQQLALTAADAHGLLADIRPDLTAMARNGNLAGADARQVLADIQSGKGSLGLLIENPDLYNRLNDTAGEAQVVMANLRQMSTEARSAIADLRSSGWSHPGARNGDARHCRPGARRRCRSRRQHGGAEAQLPAQGILQQARVFQPGRDVAGRVSQGPARNGQAQGSAHLVTLVGPVRT
jgi:phospholipid/cholesterol/gamma-HCH transport system substrate-binding protein